MRAVAAVVQTVTLEHRVVRHIHVQRVADEADVVVQDLRALGVVELHAVAALRQAYSRLPVMTLCSMRTSSAFSIHKPNRLYVRSQWRTTARCAPG